MKRFMILTVALVMACAFASWDAPPAKASDFGLHFAGRGYHIDIGRSHYRPVYYGGYSNVYLGGYGGHYDWHDTSHYDYHPGEFVRHRNHFHYVPGHYDWHETGHYDYHDGHHHGW